MAGHSKFKNIMHRKGAQDKKRSAAFSKLSREITVAAKMGTPDPDMNPRLRAAVNAAKAASMPKDNIQRAIDKASRGDAENYEEVRYEGFGPGGVSLIIEALAQAAALFSFADAGAPNLASTKIAYYLVGVDGARFRRPVVPGDQLRMEVSADKLSRSICKYTAVAKVDDQIAAEAKIMCAVRILEE